MWYQRGGLEEVLSHKMAGMGKQGFLSSDLERELVDEVSTGRFRTGGEVRDWIESEYGVCYTSEHRVWTAQEAALQPEGA